MGDTTSTQVVCGTVLLVAVLGVIAALAWHGTLTGPEVAGMLITIITLGGTALAVHSGAKVGARAAAESKK